MKEQRYTLIPSGMVCSPSGEFTRWTDLQIIRQQAKQSVEIAEAARDELTQEVKRLRAQVQHLQSELKQYQSGEHISFAEELVNLLDELQWQWQDADSYYHKPTRWECPDCSANRDTGKHEPMCSLFNLLTRLRNQPSN